MTLCMRALCPLQLHEHQVRVREGLSSETGGVDASAKAGEQVMAAFGFCSSHMRSTCQVSHHWIRLTAAEATKSDLPHAKIFAAGQKPFP